jgi:hypothetical protein
MLVLVNGSMVAQNRISHWISYWVHVKGKKNIFSNVFAPVSNFRQLNISYDGIRALAVLASVL